MENRSGPRRLHVHRPGADRLTGTYAVARIAGDASRIASLGVERSIRCPHLRILVEAARREDDALSRPDPVGSPFARNYRTRHAPVLANELGQRRFQPERYARLVQRHAQRTGERIAEREAAILARGEAERPVEPVAREIAREVLHPTLRAVKKLVGFGEMPVEITEEARRRGRKALGANIRTERASVDG